MAHRTAREVDLLVSSGIVRRSFPALRSEPEEGQPVPSCAGHRRCNSAQRAIPPALILKTVCQDLDRYRAAAILTVQYGPDTRNTAVKARPTQQHVELRFQRSPWRQHPHIGIIGNLEGAAARSLR